MWVMCACNREENYQPMASVSLLSLSLTSLTTEPCYKMKRNCTVVRDGHLLN